LCVVYMYWGIPFFVLFCSFLPMSVCSASICCFIHEAFLFPSSTTHSPSGWSQ
jgi:hypothetical protein